MGWASRRKVKIDCKFHLEAFTCPRCKKCFTCQHTLEGDLPDVWWICPDGQKVWINSDGTYKELES